MTKLEEIKARHARGMKGLTQTHHDRRWLIAEVERLEREWEIERMRLAACGVVANANTQETSKAARTMHSNYFCQSVFDVCAAVDREMAERAKIGKLRAMIRVNALRWGCSDAEIDAALTATEPTP